MLIKNGIIFVIDDTEENLRMIADILKDEVSKIYLFSSGEEVLEGIQKVVPDLILLDIMMPNMDGYEVCRRIKSDPKTKDVSIIFLTAKNETDDIVKGFEIGSVDYIVKPFKRAELIARVRTHLKLSLIEKSLKESNLEKAVKLEIALKELKETQKQVVQQERLRALGQLSSGIAHDINNSLAPILGYSDMLLNNKEIVNLAGRQLNIIRTASQDIKNTIDRMKEFYRPRTESLEMGLISINRTIKSSIDLTKHRWKDIAESEGKVVKIKTELQKDLPMIIGNESEIREALTNIIINAADAMPDGGEMFFRSFSKDENAIIEISDTGFGMDEDTLQRCLDPFYSTKGDKGTGLGLSMVFGVIDRHKGEIKIDSEKNKGTTIKLILPIDNSIIENKQIEEIANYLKPLKILSVEDDKVISEMLKKMLVSRGNKVELASNGSSGLELYQQAIEKGEPFDLLITDLGMAMMDGISLSKQIKNLTPDIPIILLTGWGSLINKDEYPTIDCLLKKPIMMEDLFKAIAGFFNDKNRET